jgi:meso-butanediol dehydrogenase/(S,S)-butanediol dehydrogenase/diacetyl reductase
MRLQDKVALVTGSGNGIGAASAKLYAREGAKVIVVDQHEEAANRTVDEIRSGGGEAAALPCDVADNTAIENMIAFAIGRFGQLDVLHNNTAWTPVGSVGDVDEMQWKRAADVTLNAYWYASKCALAHMQQRRYGVIVNTASISGLAADFGLGVYNVFKHAVVGLTRSIGIDYARVGIRCNALCPGIVYTQAYQKMNETVPERIAGLADSVPMGRFGTAEEMAKCALFLACDDSSFMTGACLVADGGRSAHTGTPSPVGMKVPA